MLLEPTRPRNMLNMPPALPLLLDCCLVFVGSSSSSSVSSSLSEYSMSLISPPTLPTHDRDSAVSNSSERPGSSPSWDKPSL
uniref:Putative secreted protein n=1 Tax=Ixodes ricinus TaxID=34613 RepID=A0A6B0U6W3_IXORI